MAREIADVLAFLEKLAPPELAESWDNVGLLVDAGRPATAILTTLDITPEVIAEAAQKKCELIVAHHPVIFHPFKRLTADDLPALLLADRISAICMHTNLDAAPGGVNDTLAALLGMQDTVPFAENCGRIGAVEPVMPEQLARHCEKLLGAHIKFVDAGKPIARLAEVSGSGGEFWQEAQALGADCLLTGEANHHAACDAARSDMSLIVAGHWATEHPIATVLRRQLANNFSDVRVEESQADADPYQYL